ncbi:hypothetical protein M2651_08810 [Clostridium sp. SYSU_GA19001]|uniref:hypothetical protein n=1 Tax=Clostridium caldaquaticum TaxID=2940653 RepID=UPI00207775DD|nr:hypothetical protein [Clostridium caldaquaticum]MCM8711127.1 hypothetical protein [Clostridium caldaquaticum]
MNWIKLILQFVAFAVIILVVYNILKYYLLSKIKINKWIVFAIAFVIFIISNFLGAFLNIDVQNNPVWIYGSSGIFIIFFLWFVDLSGWNNKTRKNASASSTYTGYGKKDKKKDIVIKPKAKPNRVKNKNN